jgi:hypothetical protein
VKKGGVAMPKTSHEEEKTPASVWKGYGDLPRGWFFSTRMENEIVGFRLARNG